MNSIIIRNINIITEDAEILERRDLYIEDGIIKSTIFLKSGVDKK